VVVPTLLIILANADNKFPVQIMQSRNAGLKGNAICMAWTGWSDQAFENQLTLVNWFPGRPYPGDSAFKLKRLSGEDVSKAVTARKQVAEFPEDIDSCTVLRIISWSNGMPYLLYHFSLSNGML